MSSLQKLQEPQDSKVENHDPIVMYIIINTSLKMTVGKAMSQLGHGVQAIITTLEQEAHEMNPPNRVRTYLRWIDESTKIVLGATIDELDALMSQFDDQNDIFHAIIDDGKTQVPPNSLTVVAFYPSNELKKIMAGLRLY